MIDKTQLAAMRRISREELTHRPGTPSRIMREREANLLMELVKLAHEGGYKFDGWPTITLHNDMYDTMALRAEVNCVRA